MRRRTRRGRWHRMGGGWPSIVDPYNICIIVDATDDATRAGRVNHDRRRRREGYRKVDRQADMEVGRQDQRQIGKEAGEEDVKTGGRPRGFPWRPEGLYICTGAKVEVR